MLWKANAYGLSFGSVLAAGSTNKPTLSIYLGGGVGFKILVSPDVIDDTDYHSIIGTFNGTALKLFVDKVFKAQLNFGGSINVSPHKFSIGSYELDTGARGLFADCLIDEKVVWDREISYG